MKLRSEISDTNNWWQYELFETSSVTVSPGMTTTVYCPARHVTEVTRVVAGGPFPAVTQPLTR